MWNEYNLFCKSVLICSVAALLLVDSAFADALSVALESVSLVYERLSVTTVAALIVSTEEKAMLYVVEISSIGFA